MQLMFFLKIIKKKYSDKFDNKAEEYFRIISASTNNIIEMINNIKEYHDNLDVILGDKESFIINDLFSELKDESAEIKNQLP
jgi:hypothetical protein